MKLIISEKIRECRTMLGITQEQLAKALGISSQSVSKWECGDGYPDITMLPTIANFFGITIDELLQETGEVCNEAISKSINLDIKEAINFLLAYHKKYPKNYPIMHNIVVRFIALGENEQEEYAERVKEICRKLLDGCANIEYLKKAFLCLSAICDEDELQKYVSEQKIFYWQNQYRIHEERAWRKKDRELSRIYCDMGRVKAMLDYLEHSTRSSYAPERSVKIFEEKLRLLEYFGGGKTPKGWIGFEERLKLILSASLFGCGKKEEGYRALEEAIALEEEWQKIPKGELLPLGNEALFGKTYVKSKDFALTAECNGKYISASSSELSVLTLGVSAYRAMTRKTGWEWFNSVREEPRFLELLAKAEKVQNMQNS